MRRGHTQGRCRSQAVKRRGKLVNNKPTQERTGPQSNQCRFNIYCPPVRVCVCVPELCVWGEAELDQRINPRWKEVDRIMTRPPFSSALPFCLSPWQGATWQADNMRREICRNYIQLGKF